MQQGEWDTQKKYWLTQLAADTEPLKLPYKTANTGVFSFNGSEIKLELPAHLTTQLKQISHKNGTTLFMSLIGLVNLLLFKYTGQQDIIIGTDIAGREDDRLEDQIGYYLNTLILKTHVASHQSFDQLLHDVKGNLLNAYDNQFYPVNKLIGELGRTGNFSPLFNVLVIFQNFNATIATGIAELAISDYPLSASTTLTDLHFEFFEQNNQLLLSLKYNTDFFDTWQVENLLTHFTELVRLVTTSPSLPILSYDLFAGDKRQLSAAFKKVDYPFQNVIDLLKESFKTFAGEIAIVSEGKRVTYQELDHRSDSVAGFLMSRQVKKGDRVGLLMHRSEELIIAVIAILKLGAAYVYIDPEYPSNRVSFIAADSDIKLMIATESARTGKDLDKLNITNYEELPASAVIPISQTVNGSGLAYIMYTSGSTGVPKGVIIDNAALADYVQTFTNYFKVSSADVVLQQSSLAFDICVEEIFPVLGAGGKLVVLTHGSQDVDTLLDAVAGEGITLLSTTPLVIKELNNAPQKAARLRVLISGGDQLKSNYIDNLIGLVDIYNTYGPTESTVCATYNKIKKLSEAGIVGSPITNRTVYVLNDAMQVVPAGVTGQIYLGGKGLAVGYQKLAAATAAAFVVAPELGERLFSTGDLGKWLNNNKLEILGRKDAQVKIRGYRVEPAEIATLLLKHPAIEDAHVLVLPNAHHEKFLSAYFILKPKGDEETSAASLKRYLNKYLPPYMVPANLIAVDGFPRTTNGKINERALAALQKEAPDASQPKEPASLLEEKILQIWKDVLAKEDITRFDNFFERGGNSIIATRLAGQISRLLDVQLSLKDIFLYSNVYELAASIKASGPAFKDDFEIAETQAYYGLSHSQKRLWALDQFQQSGAAYNLSFAFKFYGDIDKSAFEQSFRTVTERHQTLRTVFVDLEGEPKQLVIPAEEARFMIHQADLRNDDIGEQYIAKLINEHSSVVF